MKRRGFLRALGVAPLAAALPAVAALQCRPHASSLPSKGVVITADSFALLGPGGDSPFGVQDGKTIIRGEGASGSWEFHKDGRMAFRDVQGRNRIELGPLA